MARERIDVIPVSGIRICKGGRELVALENADVMFLLQSLIQNEIVWIQSGPRGSVFTGSDVEVILQDDGSFLLRMNPDALLNPKPGVV